MKEGPKHLNFLIFTVVFLSGFCALVYQIIWIREFGLLFGRFVFSVSAVLSSFMAGLALGSYFFGKLIDKSRSPLLIFLLLELVIGVFALSFPFTFKAITKLYITLSGSGDYSLFTRYLLKFGISFFFLLIPTSMMGGTLPVLSKIIITKLDVLGNRLSKLYSMNNLGAAVGCLAAGFLLIRIFGVRGALFLTAIINLLNGAAVLVLVLLNEKYLKRPVSFDPELSRTIVPKWPASLVKLSLWIFAIEGFTTLAYEIVFTQIFLDFSFDKTVYFTSTIIAAFIFGLFLGSIIISKFLDSIKNLFWLLSYMQIGIGLFFMLITFLFSLMAGGMIQHRQVSVSWLETVGFENLMLFILLILPTSLMGVTYPLVGKIINDNLDSLGNRLGILGFLDTIGSILGAFIAGFFLIPFLGTRNSLYFIVLINLLLGVVLIIKLPDSARKKSTRILLASTLFIALLFTIPSKSFFISLLNQSDKESIVYHHEGIGGTTAIHRFPNGYHALSVNGARTAFTNVEDLTVHKMLAYLPYMLKPEPQNALIIGLGMGVTTNSLAGLDLQVDVAEMCPGVIKAQSFFSGLNDSVLYKKKVNIFLDDGRSFLNATQNEYDIITSNAVHPRLSPNLYTYDFYRACQQKLSREGIVCQWIPTNWLSAREFFSLLGAFIEVFPNSSLWIVNHGHTLMVGSESREINSFRRINEKLGLRKIQNDLFEIEIFNNQVLLAMYALGPDEFQLFVDQQTVNSDNRPFVEYSLVADMSPNIEVLTSLYTTKPDYQHFFQLDTTQAWDKLQLQLLERYRSSIESDLNMFIRNGR